MSENFNSHIACEGTDNDINWVCDTISVRSL